ncbi:MAG: hypothetical protein ACRD20_19175 [Terriglobales bacterium]
MKAHQPVAMPLVLSNDQTLRARVLKTITKLFLLLAIGASLPARAQDIPRVQVFGGYSYTRFDTPSFGFSNPTGMNGWNFSPAFNLVRGFGVIAEASQQYGSHVDLRDFAVGPQFLYPWNKALFFGHILFGSARSFVRVGTGETDTDRVVALGGGMDFDVSSRFAVRAFQVDYLRTSLFSEKQSNFRFSTGLVYHWGTLKQKGHRTPAQSP